MPKKNQTRGICRLCGKEKILINSHIIPKFHWKPLKKAEGHFYVISNDPDRAERKEQREITEKLMCSYCDNDILGKNEEHLARVLYGGKNIESRDEGKLFRVKGFDYRKVKNALLSILWRMSLSSHPYFDEVCLGKKHTEKIRVALYNELAMREDEYPIFFCVPLFDGKHMGDWIIPPDFTRCEGNRIYRCLVSGFLFTFHIGSEPLSSDWQILNLKKDGSWNLLKADVLELPFLKDWCLEVGRAQNLRDQKALSK